MIMSMIQFIKTPFPYNHDGFDYSPTSFMDVQHEEEAEMMDKKNQAQQNKLMSMFASIFK